VLASFRDDDLYMLVQAGQKSMRYGNFNNIKEIVAGNFMSQVRNVNYLPTSTVRLERPFYVNLRALVQYLFQLCKILAPPSLT
jgi:hypothetical protein